MTKKILCSVLKWLAGLLVWLILAVAGSSSIGFACLWVWCLVPLMTGAINFLERKRFKASFFGPATVSKNETAQIVFKIEHQGWIPLPRGLGSIVIENQLTGEKTEQLLDFAVPSRGNTEKIIPVSSPYCGCLQIRLRKVVLFDWFGMIPVFSPVTAKRKTAVLPNLFSSDVFLNMQTEESIDSDTWAENQKGNDPAEVFALRDYREGDSLKQIHWKNSSKRQKLVVKEASLPVERSLLLFWDKNTFSPIPEHMDAMAECTASIGQGLLNRGHLFTLGWTDGKTNTYEMIDNEDDFLSMIPRFLKCGPDAEGGSGAYIHKQLSDKEHYGKVIYIAERLPNDFEPMSTKNMTLLLCNPQNQTGSWPTIKIDEKNYEEEFETLEL